MKISRKMLVALSLAATFIGGGVFTSCSEEDDDPAGAITGSNNDYTVSYTNSSTEIYRCTNTTTLKHLGALVKITINNQESTSKDGVMGFIWDLKQSKDAAKWTEGTTTTSPAITENGYQNFFVMGFQNNEGTIRYYVSRFFNVTDIQGDNFGATNTASDRSGVVTSYKEGIAATTPKELEVQTWTSLPDISSADDGAAITIADDKTLTVYADIYPVYSGSKYGVPYSSTAYSGSDNGAYIVDLYDADPTVAEVGAKKIARVTIPSETTGYTAKPDNGTLAVYANVQPNGKVLSGSWKFAETYAADEVVEE